MAPRGRHRRSRRHRPEGARHSKNTLERTRSMKDKTGQKCKPIDVFDFPDNSDVSSIGRLGENEKDEEPDETFDPPLHSTAIYADEEEFSKLCGLSIPSTPPGKEAKISSDTSGNEASEIESVKISAKKPGRKLKPISDDSESTEGSDTRRKVKSAEKTNTQRHEVIPTTASSELSDKPAESVTSKKTGPLSAQPSVEKENLAIESQSKTQKKGKMSHGKKKKSRSKAVGSDTSDTVHVWCPEGMKTSDIKELNIVLPEFEKTHLEHKERTESRACRAAIDIFYFNVKEQVIKLLKESQMLKNLKRKNAKMISDIEKKRQRMIEVQDELLRLEPQLKQLQTKYDELKERKSSLRNVAYFLSNLKQLYQDYSDVQAKEPNIKETYDSSSLPALLFKARTLLGAESHLRNINHQLEKLLDQE
ncbi:centromere protein U isoform X1 [Rhinopithecus roxellana]|uniref:centromere protein U isoform X1 n=1 Tax=Rhinopithecus roxellana TaxID=61622 RepID=UPI001237321A|nr:centromere protein U isoform X1 [Rhinopithecus roxellana]